jgi:hypothetical protein
MRRSWNYRAKIHYSIWLTIYIYIYIYRERERERERGTGQDDDDGIHAGTSLLLFFYY